MIRVALAAIVLAVTVPAQAMPWPCAIVRYYARHYTKKQLDQMAKDRGIVVTDADREDIRICLKEKK